MLSRKCSKFIKYVILPYFIIIDEYFTHFSSLPEKYEWQSEFAVGACLCAKFTSRSFYGNAFKTGHKMVLMAYYTDSRQENLSMESNADS